TTGYKMRKRSWMAILIARWSACFVSQTPSTSTTGKLLCNTLVIRVRVLVRRVIVLVERVDG
ncbi:hypothetical protein BT69DRAFT_1277816, partial [Atractiella rhizophila]